jgi:hypothetical protein
MEVTAKPAQILYEKTLLSKLVLKDASFSLQREE